MTKRAILMRENLQVVHPDDHDRWLHPNWLYRLSPPLDGHAWAILVLAHGSPCVLRPVNEQGHAQGPIWSNRTFGRAKTLALFGYTEVIP